ncbi:hypothetical protein LEP1GSC082_3911 [Leptospira kirschneri str. H2]|nr:hypothetical protein LEP1GSC082_3911 [Leptospira kirschneri str. H2]
MEKFDRLQKACNTLKINRKGLADILRAGLKTGCTFDS